VAPAATEARSGASAADRRRLRPGISSTDSPATTAIADYAGVNVATLYRHFPTKDQLIAAVLETLLEPLVTLRDRALAIEDTGDALATFVHESARLQAEQRGLVDALGYSSAPTATASSAPTSTPWTCSSPCECSPRSAGRASSHPTASAATSTSSCAGCAPTEAATPDNLTLSARSSARVRL
jgi:hypothetical protein